MITSARSATQPISVCFITAEDLKPIREISETGRVPIREVCGSNSPPGPGLAAGPRDCEMQSPVVDGSLCPYIPWLLTTTDDIYSGNPERAWSRGERGEGVVLTRISFPASGYGISTEW